MAVTLEPGARDAPWARTDEPLIWLVGSGHERVDAATGYRFDCRRRRDRHIGLQLTLAGAGFYERDGRATALEPGMAFFDRIPGDFRYGYPPGATATYEHVWVDVEGPTAGRLWEEAHRQAGPVIDLGADNRIAPLLLALAREHAAGGLADRYLASARLYEVLMAVLSGLRRTSLGAAPLAQRALALLHRRALEPEWDVRACARALGVSREHLARAFAAATGIPPKAYLLQLRLRRAQQELRGGDDGLAAVAARCGFASAGYFCRVFRERFGLTPGAYRAQPWRRPASA